ncbi:transcription antitermination protein NusB domain protein [Leptospira weilii serovar Topaz str. LT2116]|uniref:Transcription antitermination protein NusB domain protein n=1 Tax=Leptospira weilii serovar Topaz str. LT2116 TaxID=1088540 RepID=M3G2H3_9LEPT|nr:transcription antitermination protein NusB domain protein [Leptospira weilii serovar Topaz str. LT2116]
MALYQLELTGPPLKEVLKFKWYDKKPNQRKEILPFPS